MLYSLLINIFLYLIKENVLYRKLKLLFIKLYKGEIMYEILFNRY